MDFSSLLCEHEDVWCKWELEDQRGCLIPLGLDLSLHVGSHGVTLEMVFGHCTSFNFLLIIYAWYVV